MLGFSGNELMGNAGNKVSSDITLLIAEVVNNATFIQGKKQEFSGKILSNIQNMKQKKDTVEQINQQFNASIDTSVLNQTLDELYKVSNKSTDYNNSYGKIDGWRKVFVYVAYIIPLVGVLAVFILLFVNAPLLVNMSPQTLFTRFFTFLTSLFTFLNEIHSIIILWAITITSTFIAGGLNAPLRLNTLSKNYHSSPFFF